MNIKKEDIAVFREHSDLAKLANVEEFEYENQLITVEYADYVLGYFSALEKAGVDIDDAVNIFEANKKLEFVRSADWKKLMFVVLPVFGVNRIVLASTSPEGTNPLFIMVDPELFKEITKNK